MHLLDVDRVDEMDPLHIAQDAESVLPDLGAQMHRIDHFHIIMGLHHIANGVHDVLHGLAVVLPAVAGDNNDALARKIQIVEQLRGEVEVLLHCGTHGVDGGVAGDEYLAHNRFATKIFRIGLCRREMEIRHIAHQHAVHLFGIGRVFVIGPEARLHVPDGHLVVEGRQSAGKGGGRIAVDQDQVGLCLLDHPVHAQDGLGGNRCKGLLLFHDIEVVIALQPENLHDGIQHFPVLAREAAEALDLRMGRKLLHQRRHLNGLRAGAEDRHNFTGFHLLPIPPASSLPVCRRSPKVLLFLPVSAPRGRQQRYAAGPEHPPQSLRR